MIMGCAAVYVQLKNVMCCRRFRGEEERTFVRRVKEIVSQSMIQAKGGATPDLEHGNFPDMSMLFEDYP